MLRIIFSSEDIARTRVAPAADPVWESVLSLHQLHGDSHDMLTAGWRSGVGARLRRHRDAHWLRLLLSLNPPRGYFPDFLTPAASADGIEAGLDGIRSTPVSRLRGDLTVLAGHRPLPSSAPALARGDTEALGQLTDGMRRYHDLALAPYWSHIEAAVQADRSLRARILRDGGTRGLFASLRPQLRWTGGALEVPGYPATRELHLDGRGLLLVPAYFCARVPVALFDPGLPPVLVYPVDRLGPLTLPPAGTPVARRAGREALAALLGRTRAAVLAETADGCSTTELARRLGISAAAASQHTTVLRNAGLVVSLRDRNTVLHTLTPLGQAMLDAG